MELARDIYDAATDLAVNPKHTRWLVPALLALDAILCGLIIWRVPYTEIDWQAYMEQISQYMSGERDYTKIYGGTGPLVYPAAHVYTYSALYWMTDQGKNILLAQGIFAGLYLVALAFVMACYRQAKVPPYVYPMLVLSKRLHSIFILRCFNDCFAALFLWVAIFFFQRRSYTMGSLAYSWGLGVKMSMLLALPGFGVILFMTGGVRKGMVQALIMVQLQILKAIPFLHVNWKGYLNRAFEFSRQFLFKWTVNWRFVDEEIFSSKEFSASLLVGHVTVLAFFALTRWLRPVERPFMDMIKQMLHGKEPLVGIQQSVAKRVTPRLVLTTVLTANVVGMLFARSLHYQFYALLAWATPALLWQSGLPPIFQIGLWAAQEWAWNVYPSTELSSAVVVGILAMTVAGVWWGTGSEDFPQKRDEERPS
ncbi:MAG: dolichyl-P-Man:Man(5)GlcNAc(2)-PP-dolichol alpha-1,3-mannosyltransferase [Claussenomyces sp. TS43310]|nr:MAG: dolichyl-P-Man:Man(5)GlcNAc(2)-PP-dolichol alpha-1,3-mannosyltransferase [Claussenomyces sp. TS43310]